MMAFAVLEDMTGSIETLMFPRVYEENRAALVVGNVVAVRGRISSREEENPKLICEKMSLADSLSESAAEFLAQSPQRQRRFPERENANGATAEAQKPKPEQQNGKKRRPGLYIRVPTQKSRLFERISSLLSVFEGDTQVFIYFEDVGKLALAPQKLWVHPNGALTAELKRQLGEKNVALVE